MHLYLIHHADALSPAVDPQRPLSAKGREQAAHAAAAAAARGVRPTVVWHSGKLRTRRTAEAFWRECNALAAFSATRDLQPDDSPSWFRERLRGETRDILVAGHFPHLPCLLALLLAGREGCSAGFPLHGVVALRSDDEGESWTELWRLEVPS